MRYNFFFFFSFRVFFHGERQLGGNEKDGTLVISSDIWTNLAHLLKYLYKFLKIITKRLFLYEFFRKICPNTTSQIYLELCRLLIDFNKAKNII